MRNSLPRRVREQCDARHASAGDRFVDFRPGTEVVGRLGPSCARTSTATRNRESAPVRTQLGGRAGSLRMPTAAAARYRCSSTRASSPAAHHGSPPRHPGASCDAGTPRYPRVRACRPQKQQERHGKQAYQGTSRRRRHVSSCMLTNWGNVRRSAPTIKHQVTPS